MNPYASKSRRCISTNGIVATCLASYLLLHDMVLNGIVPVSKQCTVLLLGSVFCPFRKLKPEATDVSLTWRDSIRHVQLLSVYQCQFSHAK
jgi:hypothetical protein